MHLVVLLEFVLCDAQLLFDQRKMSASNVALVLVAPARSGKDFVAAVVQENFSNVKTVAFADELKRMCVEQTGIEGVWWTDEKDDAHDELGGETPRQFMIRLAKEKNSEDPRIFAKLAVENHGHNGITLFTDARRFDELDYLKEHYGERVYTVWIKGPESLVQWKDGSDEGFYEWVCEHPTVAINNRQDSDTYKDKKHVVSQVVNMMVCLDSKKMICLDDSVSEDS